ncbi:MAG: hypothetical protein E7K65_14750, partial [Pseudomonas sp.]|nr:hypothetical protein [Pseudomonas sp.]
MGWLLPVMRLNSANSKNASSSGNTDISTFLNNTLLVGPPVVGAALSRSKQAADFLQHPPIDSL